MFPQYSSNMSLVNPQDAQGLFSGGMKAWEQLGMNPEAMQAAQMLPNQQMTMPEQGMDKMAMMKMAGQALQGFAPRQQMPQQKIDIIRDQNQFRFAGTPQQQMAQALRRR